MIPAHSHAREGHAGGTGKLRTITAMLMNTTPLREYTLKNPEGGIGPLRDLYFDDDWTIRYLAADTGGWLNGRQVLIPTGTLTGRIDSDRSIETRLSNHQINDAPSAATLIRKTGAGQGHHPRPDVRPIPFYRGGILSWRTPTTRDQASEPTSFPAGGNPNPRPVMVHGVHEVTGYELHAADGRIGTIKDFIIDDETWKIRFLIVEPRYWWLGSRIAVSAEWIRQVNWSEGRLSLTLPRTTVQVAPAPRGGLALHS